MKINQFKLLLFFLFVAYSSYSQKKEYYLDENMKEITPHFYLEKCSSRVLKCLDFKTGKEIIHKVVFRFKFGSVKKIGYKQIKALLSKTSNKAISLNAIIMITYRDSLYDFKARERNYKKHILKHDSVKHGPFSLRKFDYSRKKWIKRQQKCVKRYKKLNAETFYIYKYDYGSIKTYPNLHWIKDRGMFKNTFFKIMYNSNFVVIKPNGEYFISGGHLQDKLLKKLVKNSDWTPFKKDWQNSYQSLHREGYGVFEKEHYHKPHCF